MNIYIARNGQQQGPFTQDQIRSYIKNGQILPDDDIWHEGLPHWQPVSSVFPFPSPKDAIASGAPSDRIPTRDNIPQEKNAEKLYIQQQFRESTQKNAAHTAQQFLVKNKPATSRPRGVSSAKRIYVIIGCIIGLAAAGGIGTAAFIYFKSIGPKNAARIYLNAVRISDVATMQRFSSSSGTAQFDVHKPGVSAALAFIAQMTPANFTLGKVLTDTAGNYVEVAGLGEGWENSRGKVRVVKLENAWKITSVDWEMTDAGAGVQKIRLEGGSPAPRLKAFADSLLKPSSSPFGVFYPDKFITDPQNLPKPARKLHGESCHLAFSVDGNLLIAAGYGDYIVRVWDTRTWTVSKEFKLDNRPTGLAVIPDGTGFIVADAYGNVHKCPLSWDAVAGDISQLASGAGTQPGVAVDASGRFAATVASNKVLTLWDIAAGQQLAHAQVPVGLRSVAFSPAAGLIAAGTVTNVLYLWNLTNGQGRKYTIPKAMKNSDISSIAFSRDGSMVATGHMDASITVWKVMPFKAMHNFYLNQNSVHAIKFTPDAGMFATAHNDCSIRLWNTESGQQAAVLSGHSSPVNDITFHPNGRMMASAGTTSEIVIWISSDNQESDSLAEEKVTGQQGAGIPAQTAVE